MIAEENLFDHSEEIPITLDETAIINFIIDIFKETTQFFKEAIKNSKIIKPINENKLTQIFVEQLNVQLRKRGVSFIAQNQYSDLFHETKGIPDFYFHQLEQGTVAMPLFIVEAKRLPAPDSRNQKEYVIGTKLNGGIERFKLEKHGKGLFQCGMIGFVEDENFQDWIIKINGWITELASTHENWSNEEIIKEDDTQSDFAYLNSIVITKSTNKKIHHFWIKSK